MKLTLKKLLKVKKLMEAMPSPFHKCRKCGKEYWVFGEIEEGCYIVCDEC